MTAAQYALFSPSRLMRNPPGPLVVGPSPVREIWADRVSETRECEGLKVNLSRASELGEKQRVRAEEDVLNTLDSLDIERD